MRRLFVFVLAALAVLVVFSLSYCAQEKLSKEKIIDIATIAVKEKGFSLSEVDIIYDEGGRLWCEALGRVGFEDKSPNHGILKKGFLKNYRIVFFDYKAPIKDVWVFIDKDTGEVLTVYREK
jgi:hypothetical protein